MKKSSSTSGRYESGQESGAEGDIGRPPFHPISQHPEHLANVLKVKLPGRLLVVALITACGESGVPAGDVAEGREERGLSQPAALDTGGLEDGIELDAEATGWTVRELAHAPAYFLASGWRDPETVWGLAGNTPVFVETSRPEYSSLRESYWDAARSSRGTMAGLDEAGLFLDGRLVLPRSAAANQVPGDLTGPLIWSPDGTKILLRGTQEGPVSFGILDATSGELERVPDPEDGLYLIDAFGWLDADRALLSAASSLATETPTTASSALAEYSASTGQTRRIGVPTSGALLQPLALWDQSHVLVEERGAESTRHWIYDTRDWSRRSTELPAPSRLVVADSTHVLVITRQVGDGDPIHRLSLRVDDGTIRPLLRTRGRDVRVFWSPDRRRLAISAAGELVRPDSSVEAYYRSWVIEER